MASAEADLDPDVQPRKSRAKGLLFGIFLAVLLGGGGFYAVWSGLVLGTVSQGEGAVSAEAPPMPDISFVPVDPLLISLGPGSRARILRFQAQLEVSAAYVDDVTKLLPRVVDVLNSYLRAVEVSELEQPGALTRLRAQMLRRVQIVVGDGRVRDLLIMEFVVN